MSEHHIEVVRIGAVEKHPNADTLSVTHVHGGYPAIFRSGDFREGDLAVYVPVDAIVPAGDPRWAFLGDHRRVKAKRLRGIFSMGLLTPAEPGWVEGQDVAAELRIEKFVPPAEREDPVGAERLGGPSDNERDPGVMSTYTDIEGLRRMGTAFEPGEMVVITEKIHGANARFVFTDGRLWIGSRTRIKRSDGDNVWTRVAARYDLATKLAACEGLALYGEVYGDVQDLRYGCAAGEQRFIAFDAFDTRRGVWLDHAEFCQVVDVCLGVDRVPVLYLGAWEESLRGLCEGLSELAARSGATQIREGIVIKPLRERCDDRWGRVVSKLVSETYLLRNEAA